jgi:glucose dehydrogenase
MTNVSGFSRRWLLIAATLCSSWMVFAFQRPSISDDALRNSGTTGEDWLTVGLNYAEQRYSPLTQINPRNVNFLRLAWQLDVGQGGGGQEATPLMRAPGRKSGGTIRW